MEDDNSTGTNLIWAITIIIIVAIIAGALFYGGAFRNRDKHEIDVKVDVPATNR